MTAKNLAPTRLEFFWLDTCGLVVCPASTCLPCDTLVNTPQNFRPLKGERAVAVCVQDAKAVVVLA